MAELNKLIEELPPDLQEEVIDFIKFLIEKKNKEVPKDNLSTEDISKFAGTLKALSVEPLKYQRKMREEWG